MNVYVVIVETGEYSDRNDWIGGVFDDRTVAERMIKEKLAAARQYKIDYESWVQKRYAICRRMSGHETIYLLSPENHDALMKEAGPPPDGVSGDRYYLVEVPLNKWGEFSYCGEVSVEMES